MKLDKAAHGRPAESVFIVAQFPINVSFKNSITLTGNDKATTVYLATATITITQAANGEVIIVIEPP